MTLAFPAWATNASWTNLCLLLACGFLFGMLCLFRGSRLLERVIAKRGNFRFSVSPKGLRLEATFPGPVAPKEVSRLCENCSANHPLHTRSVKSIYPFSKSGDKTTDLETEFSDYFPDQKRRRAPSSAQLSSGGCTCRSKVFRGEASADRIPEGGRK